ncbi:hypothetical protein BS78_04G042600 [Paspalum vaginatum]|nr:hypothetical protein BS78_04G042600 [Paspalum vaginatum]
MAATKLNPNAAPFSPRPLQLAQPAPAPLTGSCPRHYPFATHVFVASPHGHIGLCFPLQPPPSAPVLRKGVPAAAAHGRPPHKLMKAFSGPRGAGKQQTALKPWKEPAAAVAVAAAPAQVRAVLPRKPRLARRKAERRRSQAKAPRPRKAAGPRARPAAQRARSPPPPPSKYTRRTQEFGPVPPPQLGSCTTVMIRNIPNRLRWDDMIALLDEHCGHANRTAGAVVSAYDFLYLPMDFRRQGNFGYAFVNFTKPEASVGLYHALHWCVWKVCGSSKVIEIVRAKIQGKEKLELHFGRKNLKCGDRDEFLPAVFPRPRDGVTAGCDDSAPRRLGGRPTAAATCCASTQGPEGQQPLASGA